MKYGVDKGHTISGSNYGASGFMEESKETRVIGDMVVAILKAEGNSIVDCTVDKASSNSESINLRVQKANAQRLDLFVSIHFNCSTEASANGSEVLTCNGKFIPQADMVLKNLEKLKFRNRGIKNGTSPRRIAVVNNTAAPAILIEVCFVSSKDDCDKYNVNKEKVARAIAYGIMNKSYSETSKPSIPNTEGDEDMIPSIKLSACAQSPIAKEMKVEIEALQSCMGITPDGIATQELCMKLPVFKGGESKGTASVLQTILQLKNYLSKDTQRPPLGPAVTNALNKLKKDCGIPECAELTNPIVWRKVLEY
ncbi:MAG: N-acetylmuramoyl-L-alanine amidase [Anaerovoracaceae bacterium]